MTRILLSILAVIEAVLGMFGLVAAINLILSHAPGMTMLLMPVLAMIALLLLASAAIFIRRPWSYYVHIAVIVLIGVLYALYISPLAGADALFVLLPAALIVAVLTGVFLLPAVRRYFGVNWKKAPATE